MAPAEGTDYSERMMMSGLVGYPLLSRVMLMRVAYVGSVDGGDGGPYSVGDGEGDGLMLMLICVVAKFVCYYKYSDCCCS